MLLALTTLLKKSDAIVNQGMPIVSCPEKFVGESLSANMDATSSFVDFDKYGGSFMFSQTS